MSPMFLRNHRGCKGNPNAACVRPSYQLEQLEPRQLLAVFVVNTNADTIDPADNRMSLREAIVEANNTAGADEIHFAGRRHIRITNGLLPTITEDVSLIGQGARRTRINAMGRSGMFVIDDATLAQINVLFQGMAVLNGASATGGGAVENAENLTITNSVFARNSGVTGGAILNSGTLTLENTALVRNSATQRGGAIFNAPGGEVDIMRSVIALNFAEGDGGGILNNNGTLTIERGVLVRNSTNDDGGAIFTFSGECTVIDSVISANSAADDGGGVFVAGSGNLTVEDSLVTRNRAGDDGGGLRASETSVIVVNGSSIVRNRSGSDGGGIFNDAQSELRVERTTLASNIADGFGGGIHSRGETTVIASTLQHNVTAFSGGAIFNTIAAQLVIDSSTLNANIARSAGGGIASDAGAQAEIVNSTISGNRAQNGGGILTLGTLLLTNNTVAFNRGIGIVTMGETVAHSNIIANNRQSRRVFRDIDGEPLAAGSSFNLVRDADSAGGLENGVDGNKVGVNPRLLRLRNNGGPTLTHALHRRSVAIDAGTNTASLAFDQRGTGFTRTVGSGTDIGAYEVQ